MKTDPTPEQIAKLPAWAQKHIASLARIAELERERADAVLGGVGQPQRRSNEDPHDIYGMPSAKTYPLICLGYHIPLGFPDDKTCVTFSMLPNRAAFDEAAANRGRLPYIQITQDPNCDLNIHCGDGDLHVLPRSTNTAILRLGER